MDKVMNTLAPIFTEKLDFPQDFIKNNYHEFIKLCGFNIDFTVEQKYFLLLNFRKATERMNEEFFNLLREFSRIQNEKNFTKTVLSPDNIFFNSIVKYRESRASII